MQAYLGNQDIILTIPMQDSSGALVSATGVEYRVIDQHDNELVAKTTLTSYTTGDTSVDVAVLAANNALGTELRALRVIELFAATAAGTVVIAYEYIIEASAVLSVGINSFQGYSAATLVGYELPNLPGWNEATRVQRMNALIAAYRNFGKLALRYIGEGDMTRTVTPAEWNHTDITQLDAGSLLTLPADYYSALCRAQVYEADFLLGGDEVGDIRRSGIMSATVGESSQFFRPAKPYQAAVCNRALKELSKYLITSHRVGRG